MKRDKNVMKIKLKYFGVFIVFINVLKREMRVEKLVSDIILYLCKDMNEKLMGSNNVKMRILILFLLLIGGSAQASHPDSLSTRWVNGKKFILHKIEPKETYSSLSRRYHLTIAEIQDANAGVVSLKIGQIVNIPSGMASQEKKTNVVLDESKANSALPQNNKSVESTSKQNHIVKKGETLYAISRLYGMPVDEIKKLNGLSSNAVAIGQKLKVISSMTSSQEVIQEIKKLEPEIKDPAVITEPEKEKIIKEEVIVKVDPKEISKEAIPAPIHIDTQKILESKKNDTTELPKVYSNPGTSRTSVIEKDPKTGIEVEKITEVGVATWMTEGDLNQNKFYALHRTAPVGSIIKVTNRMNNNSVFVKVVAALPDTGDNNASIIKITQAAAQRIGAIDQKFTAELSYGLTK